MQKRMWAEELAAVLFDWDFEDMADYELYTALEECGYEWDGDSWVPTEE
ncbi:MAG TPA: hypothetical protein VFT99_12175 [Roseiflexaceae bacterium]|nr:hypothetical protein [Roseiflexaceae bacterium]